MKKICLAVWCLFAMLMPAFAQTGINFETNWETALAKANEQNKVIFLDAYTTWCGPCKKMDKEVYPNAEVGSFYNKNFINIKLDMEKGVGKELAKKYNVVAFPTFLFIDKTQNVIHQTAGYRNPSEFVAVGQQAMQTEDNLASMDARFRKGDRNPDFLLKYTKERFDIGDDSHFAAADAYLETQDNWFSERNVRFLMEYADNPSNVKIFQFMAKNKAAFYALYKKNLVDAKIENLIYNRIYNSTTAPTLEEVQKTYRDVFPEKADLLYANYKMSYYRQAGDRKNYAQAAIERFDKLPCEDAGELNDAAFTFYRVIEDKQMLRKALEWANKSVKLSKEYANYDTVSALHYKLGDKAKAKKFAKKAIKIAKKDQEDYSETSELLKKIEAMPK